MPIEEIIQQYRRDKFEPGLASLEAVQAELYLSVHDLVDGDWKKFSENHELQEQAKALIDKAYSATNARMPLSHNVKEALASKEGVDGVARFALEKMLWGYSKTLKEIVERGSGEDFHEFQARAQAQGTKVAWSQLIGKELTEKVAGEKPAVADYFARKYDLQDGFSGGKYSTQKLYDMFDDEDVWASFLRNELTDSAIKTRIKKDEDSLIRPPTPAESAHILNHW